MPLRKMRCGVAVRKLRNNAVRVCGLTAWIAELGYLARTRQRRGTEEQASLQTGMAAAKVAPVHDFVEAHEFVRALQANALRVGKAEPAEPHRARPGVHTDLPPRASPV